MAEHPFITGRWLDVNHFEENEKWNINRNHQNEITSFCYIPSQSSNSIFLGSFPIYEITEGRNNGNQLDFFYGSTDNNFWPILGRIFNHSINNVEERINLLNEKQLGITDVLLEIRRIQPQLSDDRNLEAIRYNDIVEIVTKHPTIKNIFITSGGKAPVSNLQNTKNVATWLKDYAYQNFNRNRINGFNQNGYVKNISIQNVEFKMIYLYSPSGLANISIQGILNKNDNFNIPNLNIELFRQYQWEYFLKKYHFNIDTNIQQQLIDFFEQ